MTKVRFSGVIYEEPPEMWFSPSKDVDCRHTPLSTNTSSRQHRDAEYLHRDAGYQQPPLTNMSTQGHRDAKYGHRVAGYGRPSSTHTSNWLHKDAVYRHRDAGYRQTPPHRRGSFHHPRATSAPKCIRKIKYNDHQKSITFKKWYFN